MKNKTKASLHIQNPILLFLAVIFCNVFHLITLAKELTLLLPRSFAQAAIVQIEISCL
jgi:hypothetical protein